MLFLDSTPPPLSPFHSLSFSSPSLVFPLTSFIPLSHPPYLCSPSPLSLSLSFSLQTKSLKVTNPSRYPVVVQPILLHYYPQPQRITQLLFETGLIESLNFSLSESSFSLDPDLWGYDRSLESHTLAPQSVGRGGGGREKGEGDSDMEVRVKFLARESRLGNSLLLLRNNLTGLECVLLQGRGLEGRFSIDGVQPDTGNPLLFQPTSTDLEACSGTYVSIRDLWFFYHGCLSIRPLCIYLYDGVQYVTI